MRLHFLLLTTIVAVVTSCKSKNDPNPASVMPLADFSYSTSELNVSFVNNSKNATSFEWDFGDNSSSITKNPTHTYSRSGTYIVTLTAYNRDNKFDKYTHTINVSYKRPIAAFSFKVEQPMTVILTNKSTDATSYLWDFGDGQTSTEKSPSHRYSKIGIYPITLTATRGDQSSSKSTHVTIEKPTHIYIKGFQFGKVPYNNMYYYVKVIDDDFITSTWVRTVSELLHNSILPYDFILATPVALTGIDGDNYYTMQLYYNSSPTGDGTLVQGYKITKTQILEYPVSIIGRGTNNELTIYFDYK